MGSPDSGLEKKTWCMQFRSCSYPRNFFQKWNSGTVSNGGKCISTWWVGPPEPFTLIDWLWAQPDKWSVRLAGHTPFSNSWGLWGGIKHIPSMPLPHSSMALFSQTSLRQKMLYGLGWFAIHHPSFSTCNSFQLHFAWCEGLGAISYPYSSLSNMSAWEQVK